MITINLPRRQKELFDLLFGKGDVLITDLYAAMRGPQSGEEDANAQYPQRWLGSYITALNRSLADQGLRVEPGQMKNTYRLISTT